VPTPFPVVPVTVVLVSLTLYKLVLLKPTAEVVVVVLSHPLILPVREAQVVVVRVLNTLPALLLRQVRQILAEVAGVERPVRLLVLAVAVLLSFAR
jgi:hypothetical protein